MLSRVLELRRPQGHQQQQPTSSPQATAAPFEGPSISPPPPRSCSCPNARRETNDSNQGTDDARLAAPQPQDPSRQPTPTHDDVAAARQHPAAARADGAAAAPMPAATNAAARAATATHKLALLRPSPPLLPLPRLLLPLLLLLLPAAACAAVLVAWHRPVAAMGSAPPAASLAVAATGDWRIPALRLQQLLLALGVATVGSMLLHWRLVASLRRRCNDAPADRRVARLEAVPAAAATAAVAGSAAEAEDPAAASALVKEANSPPAAAAAAAPAAAPSYGKASSSSSGNGAAREGSTPRSVLMLSTSSSSASASAAAALSSPRGSSRWRGAFDLMAPLSSLPHLSTARSAPPSFSNSGGGGGGGHGDDGPSTASSSSSSSPSAGPSTDISAVRRRRTAPQLELWLPVVASSSSLPATPLRTPLIARDDGSAAAAASDSEGNRDDRRSPPPRPSLLYTPRWRHCLVCFQ
ncbi:hypothetical protein PLESTF_001475600, partial [Pleodorina starrii]